MCMNSFVYMLCEPEQCNGKAENFLPGTKQVCTSYDVGHPGNKCFTFTYSRTFYKIQSQPHRK